MAAEELAAKKAYFQDQALLDISDDEHDFRENGKNAFSRALDDSKDMPAPKLKRQGSSFLGPTPKERQAEFDAYTAKQRADARANERSFAQMSFESAQRGKLERMSLSFKGEPLKKEQRIGKDNGSVTRSNLREDQTPFYIRTGTVPRELKNGKIVKPADKIKLEPEHKQLLKGKIIYFYPNDDVSMVRRTRIHKIIQLGAAWVNRWRDDVTHIMLDDASYSYTQLLKHLNKPGFTKRVVLVKFDPYVPQCIQFGTLLDPTATRFAIKGAPHRTQSIEQIPSSQSTDPSQLSLKVKPSKTQKAALGSPRTESNPTEPSLKDSTVCPRPSSEDDIVKDSFTGPSFDNGNEDGTKPSQFGDALSRAIEEAKAVAHLPLDDDESDSSPTAPVDSDDEAMDEAITEPVINLHNGFSLRVSKASALRDKKSNTNTFQCMNPSSGILSASNPNARTIQILEEMGRHYDQMQDHWRTTAYRKAVTTLKKQTTKINTAQEAARLPFIGLRLAEKIEEIVLTNRLRKLDNTKDDPLDSVLRLFLGIYGVGLVQANKWIQAGHRTLDDLKEKAKLTDSHKIGIDHYADFNSRISRTEVEAHGAIVKAALKKLNPSFEATVMGSYRRGAKDSGDIDMIVTCPGATASALRTVVFDTLVPQLFKADFLKASLATSHSNDTTGSKWHGASCLPSSTIWRRMDFLLVPDTEIGAALIYFTGNDIFNRSIRLLARKNGMRLNQRGLYKDVQRGRQGEKLNDDVLVEGRSERKIFEILGVPWREPHERIC